MKIYLAGAITGLGWDSATDWRDQLRDLVPTHIQTLSPLRGKQYLEKRSSAEGVIKDSYEEYPLSSARGINTRDHWDVMRCDAVFVNLLGTTKVSIGTVMEIAWAFAYKKPLVLVMEQGNIHEHSMLKECTGFRVDTFEKGVEVLIALCSTDKQIQSL